MKRRPVTESDIEFIKENYLKRGAKFCANHLGRTPASVYQLAEKHGIKKELRYSEQELDLIRKNYESMGPEKLSKIMKRSRQGINGMAVRLNLSVGETRKKELRREARAMWTEDSMENMIDKAKLRRGSLSPSWKGGIVNISEMIRGRLYSAWSKYVFQRDDYTCRLCGLKGGRMVVHHVRTFAQIRDVVIAEHPELNPEKYEDMDKLSDLVIDSHRLSDGVTLCLSCHKKHHLENGVNCGDILPGNAEDNPHPSRGNVVEFVPRKVQRLTGEEQQTNNPDTSAPLSVSHG